MKGVIEVLDQEEYDAKMAGMKSAYVTLFPEKDPSAAKPADTVKIAAKPVEPAAKVVAKM
jgi:cytochrome c oxidase subunit 2